MKKVEDEKSKVEEEKKKIVRDMEKIVDLKEKQELEVMNKFILLLNEKKK